MTRNPPRPLASSWQRLLFLRGTAAGLLALALSACASEARAPASTSQGLLKQIEAEIGDAACSSDQQCRTLALGAKACGGPDRYIAWSTARSKADKLAALGERYKAERMAENMRSGALSNCMFEVDPGAQCKAQRCQLGGGSGGALLR